MESNTLNIDPLASEFMLILVFHSFHMGCFVFVCVFHLLWHFVMYRPNSICLSLWGIKVEHVEGILKGLLNLQKNKVFDVEMYK